MLKANRFRCHMPYSIASNSHISLDLPPILIQRQYSTSHLKTSPSRPTMSSVDLSSMDNMDFICRPGSIALQTPLVSQREPASQLSFSCPRPDGGESMPTSTIQHKSTRSQEPREQRWEDLKLLIRQIYIEEGKPFPYLAKVLEEEYDFKVT